ncbi:thioesterase family protein [Streptomyces noursei]|uniref:acyl-CoA thioesterase n=1 Tax=Streptomyces noursei TaxID=1971 RepID=UPI00081C4A3C|nr:thioesterase superfamily protein [Streptomyces noursei ATCC 11455]MCZ0992280.1 thioesterase family protein [Streptomyces noursei]
MHSYIYPCPLRWADADAYGHINNALFLRYMEEARTRMFREVLPADEVDRRRNAFVVSRASIDYRAPLHYRETPIDVHVWVTQHRAVSFELAYEIRDADQLYVEGTTTIAAYNLDTGRPRRLSEAERAFLARYTVS